jgi:hypothetical protein
MAKFSFVTFLTRVSKSLGRLTPNALKPYGLKVIGLILVTWELESLRELSIAQPAYI